MLHGTIAIVNAPTSATHCSSDGRCLTPATGNTTSPTAAIANGNSTNTGRLSVVSASSTPAAANVIVRRDSSARSAIQIDAVKRNVVSTSVITSAPKYGIGGKSAVTNAATSAARSLATRRTMSNTSRQMSAKSTVCASATGTCPVPATL